MEEQEAGGSVVFGVVESADEEEEDDDIQRKEELHQLLCEQLPDNLLDDSACSLTSVEDGDLSILSTPQQSHADFGDVTLDVSMETPMMMPQVIESHDHHMTPPALNTDHTPHTLDLSQMSPGYTGGMEPGQQFLGSHAGMEPGQQLMGSHAVMEPGQQFMGTHTSTEPGQQFMTASLGMESGQRYVIGIEPGQQQHRGVEKEQSDIFSGTSQAYYNREQADRIAPQLPTSEMPLPPPPLSSGGRGGNYASSSTAMVGGAVAPPPGGCVEVSRQLEVLCEARGRQVGRLEEQLRALSDEHERHLRILRHEKELLVEEQDGLSAHAQGAESARQALEAELAGVKGRLEAEHAHRTALEANKRELLLKLHSSEAAVEGLMAQVSELASADTVGRLRGSYSAALEEAEGRWREEVTTLGREVEEGRREGEEKDAVIANLHQDLAQLRRQYDLATASDPAHPPTAAASSDPPGSSNESSSVAQQLDFVSGEGGDGVRGEGVMAERVVMLAAQVEDLSFQLSTTREELDAILHQLRETEAALSAQSASSQVAMAAREGVLREEMEQLRVEAEADKKQALEQCRQACLRLHEAATQRVKEALERGKDQLQLSHRHLVTQLREELATVQLQYAEVCKAKDALTNQHEASITAAVATALEKAQSDWTIEKQEAVGVAKSEWRRQLTNESTASVKQALEEQSQSWNERVEKEKASAVAKATEHFTSELSAAREEWEGERGRLRAEHCEVVRAELLAECEGEREGRERELLTTAHREWSKAQEAVSRAEVEGRVKAVQAESRARHESELARQLSEAAAEHSSEREGLLRELQALEERLVLLQQQQQQQQQKQQQQQQQSRGDASTQTATSGVARPSSGVVARPSSGGLERPQLSAMLQGTGEALKKDLHQLVLQLLSSQEQRWRSEVARVRTATAQQVQDYYLHCLHQLVNSEEAGLPQRSHDQSRDHVAVSHDHRRESRRPVVEAQDQHGESHEQVLASHDHQRKSHDMTVGTHDQQKVSHDQKPKTLHSKPADKNAKKSSNSSFHSSSSSSSRHPKPTKTSGSRPPRPAQTSAASGHHRSGWLSATRH